MTTINTTINARVWVGEVLVEGLDDVVIGIFDLRWEIRDCLDDLVESLFEGGEFLGNGRESLFERRKDIFGDTAGGGGAQRQSTGTTFLFRGRRGFSWTARSEDCFEGHFCGYSSDILSQRRDIQGLFMSPSIVSHRGITLGRRLVIRVIGDEDFTSSNMM
jgi:hypothetical protein